METLNKTGFRLNELLEKNYDTEKCYLEAAKKANDSNLQRFFITYARQRYRFGHDIKGQLKETDQFINKGGSIGGALHRAWLDAKVLFSSSSDKALIEECLRGEELAIKDYEEALKMAEEMSPTIHEMIIRQLNGIKEAKISLQELKESY